MKYTVTGPQPAYGTNPGGTVTLDEDDPLVQMNVTSGVITPAGDAKPPAPKRCPACTEQGEKTPPTFSTQEELADHYGDAHPALVAPSMKDGE